MKISIAMATYNGSKYLQEQLNSFVNQTRQPDELVVCDDGSSDSTVEILNNFARAAPFEVRIIENEKNLGFAKNFEKALSLCVGGIIFISDQDDVWFDNKIHDISEYLTQRDDVLLVRSDMELTDAELNSNGVSQLENMLSLGDQREDFGFGCGIAVKKEFLDIAFPIPMALWGHDRWLLRLATALNVADLYDEVVMYYRRHENNASDSLASATGRINQLAIFKVYGLQSATRGWRDEVQRLSDLEERIHDSIESLEALGLGDSVRKAQASLNNRRKDLEFRIRYVSLPRWKRGPKIISLWFRGGYQHFRGWKSVVKDLIRP